MLVIGDKEMTENQVSVRKHGEGDKGSMELEKFIALIVEETNRNLN